MYDMYKIYLKNPIMASILIPFIYISSAVIDSLFSWIFGIKIRM